MKLLIFVMALGALAVWSSIGFANIDPQHKKQAVNACWEQSEDNNAEDVFNTDTNVCTPEENIEEARRGCCSHHGGVCGCADGRSVCCDGQLSPSCGC